MIFHSTLNSSFFLSVFAVIIIKIVKIRLNKHVLTLTFIIDGHIIGRMEDFMSLSISEQLKNVNDSLKADDVSSCNEQSSFLSNFCEAYDNKVCFNYVFID